MQPVIGRGAAFAAIVLGGSLAGAPPPSTGALDPPAWLAGSYAGSITAVETPVDPVGAGTAAAPRPEVRVTVSFLVLPDEGGAGKRIILVRAAPPGEGGGPSPAGGDAALWTLEGAAPVPAGGDELFFREGFLGWLAPSIFGPLDVAASGKAETEEEVRVHAGVPVKLPLRASATRAGPLLTVTRTLAAGTTAPVEIGGSPSTVERWSETRVVDLDRRAVERVRREQRIVLGRERIAIDGSVELGLEGATVLDEASRARVRKLAQGVEAVLAGFREKKPPREIYDLIKALPARERSDLLRGLEDALAAKLARYRQARDVASRKNRAAPPVEVAPDFTLESLDGRKVSFKEATRGKVTLLTFWGYGCPPCRVEGPYLTKLHETYAERGFTVLAVNAYDEPRELVQAFVERARLKHPILLMGRQVARDLYRVNRYPTSLWIDRAGKVVAREPGFSAASFPRMEARVKEMLEKADHLDR